MSDSEPLDPEVARFVSKVRRLMALAGATTLIAIAAVLGVIGYRVFRVEERPPPAADATALIPKGARVLATAVADDRLVVTIDVAGAVEVHVFDLKTLRRVGRLKLATEP